MIKSINTLVAASAMFAEFAYLQSHRIGFIIHIITTSEFQ